MDLKLRNNSQLTLPSDNIVDYIECSGYPNIDTGITYPDNPSSSSIFRIETVIEVLDGITDDSILYMSRHGASTNSRGWFGLVYKQVNDNKYIVYNCTSPTSTQVNINFTGKVKIVHNSYNTSNNTNNYIEINGVKITTPTPISASTLSPKLYLFSSGNCKLRVYYYKIFTGSSANPTLRRNYIPVASNQEGHINEAALYDTVTNTYYYSNSTGSFTASTPQGLYGRFSSVYIKDCPNISSIDLLRKAVNLQRIRCDVGNVSGSVAELFRYTALAGFTDDYQEQQIPRIIGTWTLNNWYTNEELENFQGAIDGLTVVGDGTHNVETALENDNFAIQTIDSSKPNYNPAVAIRLNANGYGCITTNRIINNGGRFVIGKNEASTITTLPVNVFRGITTVVDENSIVTDDDEAEYDFNSFDEFKYFTGITTITAGSSITALGLFGGCTKLSSIKIPYGVTTIGAYSFCNCTALSGSLVFPDTVTSIGGDSLHNIPNVSNVYIPCNFSNACVSSVNNMGNSILGSNTGVLCIKGNHKGINIAQIPSLSFTKIFVYGNISAPRFMYSSSTFCIRVKGSANITGYALTYTNGYFFEVMSDITKGTSGAVFISTNAATNNKTICHLGYNNLVSIPCNYFGVAKASMIYVGDGSSRANDEAILALYLADTNWNAQSAKLGTWWDYNGEYKWYYITDNLTNCINTNPDEWPHITRG